MSPRILVGAGLRRRWTRTIPSTSPHSSGQVFGGPPNYTQDGGSHAAMIHRHMNKHLTPEQRKRWVACCWQTADDVGTPTIRNFAPRSWDISNGARDSRS